MYLETEIGKYRDTKGGEGCYMELFRRTLSLARVYGIHEFMLVPGGYERAIRGVLTIISELPGCQSDEVLTDAHIRIETAFITQIDCPQPS